MAAVGCPGELGWTVLSEPDVQGGGGFGVCVSGDGVGASIYGRHYSPQSDCT